MARQQQAIETLEENVLMLAGRLSAVEGSATAVAEAPSTEATVARDTPQSPRAHTRVKQRVKRLLKRTYRSLPGALRRAAERRRAVRAIRASSLFDGRYYRKENPDIGDLDPAWHYVQRGASERRDPHPFFDTSFYLRAYPDVAKSGVNPLVHFLRSGLKEKRDPTPLFDTSHYLERNPDVAASALPAFEHFLKHGLSEGRSPLSPARLSELIAPFARGAGSDVASYLYEGAVNAPRPAISIVEAESPEGLEAEVQRLLVSGFGAQRIDVATEPNPAEASTVRIAIAPHRHASPDALSFPIDDTTVVNTASFGSPDFVRSLPHLFRAKRVLDLDYQSAALLRTIGIPAHFLPLGPLRGFEPYDSDGALPDEPATLGLPARVRAALPVMGVTPFVERPLDIVITGDHTADREAFLAAHASLLERYNCFIHLGADASESALAGLGRRSKIVLNLHTGAVPTFDWRRVVMLGLWQGALVVTERSPHPPELRPGEHYLEAERGELPALLRWLLESEAGVRRAAAVSAAGHEALWKSYDLVRVTGRLAALLRSTDEW